MGKNVRGAFGNKLKAALHDALGTAALRYEQSPVRLLHALMSALSRETTLRVRSEYPLAFRLSAGWASSAAGAECGTWSTAVSSRSTCRLGGADERREAGEAESLLSARREAVRGRSACCCLRPSASPSLAPRRASLSSARFASANFGWAR